MIVASSTSPLTNLAVIGQCDLLRHLYGHICIPAAVWDEFNHITGVIAALRSPKEKGLIDRVRPHLAALRSVAGLLCR